MNENVCKHCLLRFRMGVKNRSSGGVDAMRLRHVEPTTIMNCGRRGTAGWRQSSKNTCCGGVEALRSVP